MAGAGAGAGEEQSELREQLFPSLRIFDEDRADGAVLRCLQDLLDRIPCGITFGAIVSHMAFPTHTSWSTRTRNLRATDRPYCQVTGSDFSDRNVMLG